MARKVLYLTHYPDQAHDRVVDLLGAETVEICDHSRGDPLPADAQDVIVIYSDGRFLDTDLRPLDPASISGAGRVVLAFVPDVPLAEAMVARAAISATNLVVSTLDERWLEALAELNP